MSATVWRNGRGFRASFWGSKSTGSVAFAVRVVARSGSVSLRCGSAGVVMSDRSTELTRMATKADGDVRVLFSKQTDGTEDESAPMLGGGGLTS